MATLLGHHPQMVDRISTIGLVLEDLPIEPLRVRKPAISVVIEGLLEEVVDGIGRHLCC